MAALISIELCLYRRPAGIPYCAIVIDVEITTAHIERYVVIAITCNSSEPCVLIEAVAAGSIGNKGEESLIAEVVDPRIGCLGSIDDVLFTRVIEMTEFHVGLPPW